MKELESQFEGDDRGKEITEKELKRLIEEYSCGVDIIPRWCVYGRDRDGSFGVLHWVRPSEEERFVAKKMAKYINTLGGSAVAEMTEWNKDRKGKVVYSGEEHLSGVIEALSKIDDNEQELRLDADAEKNFALNKLEELLEQYLCLPTEGANWSISGDGPDGEFVLYWVRPGEDEELIARKIAKYINKLGGSVIAERKMKIEH